MPSRKKQVKAVAAILAMGVLGVVLHPATTTARAGTHTTRLVAVALPATLPGRYGLPVVPMPPPPGALPAAAPADGMQCPVEVRALVVGETKDDALAMVARHGGVDDEAMLLKTGHTVRLRSGVWRVASVEADKLVLVQGDTAVRCPLANHAR